MNTEEAMIQLNSALIQEGISDEERQHRLTIFEEVVAEAEKMSAKLNEQKAILRSRRMKKVIPLSNAIEASIIAAAIGWFTGIYTLFCYQLEQ